MLRLAILLQTALHAAALVPVPTPIVPRPYAGIEPNRGQINAPALFLSRGSPSIAVTAQSILFSPLGVEQRFIASNPNPTVSFSDPLPGVANSFTGPDRSKWILNIPRYATAHLTGLYPGIDAEYSLTTTGEIHLRMIASPGVSLANVVFEFPTAQGIQIFNNGAVVLYGSIHTGPFLSYGAPVASQGTIMRDASFEARSNTQLGLKIVSADATLPLIVEFTIAFADDVLSPAQFAADAQGNTYAATTINDAAGKDAPFAASAAGGAGCLISIASPLPCSDVAVSKYSNAGELIFVDYLCGRTQDVPATIEIGPDGSIVVTGTTDSDNFPTTASAFQPAYAGPPAAINNIGLAGDMFATKIDASTGTILASTYLGGPKDDKTNTARVGADGSVYFLPALIGHYSAGLPTTTGALMRECELSSSACANGYVARLSPALDKLIYGTYLPGLPYATAKLHADGSVYYAGAAQAGFPTTPGAYQSQPVSGYDAIVARLDPTGSRLLFATYVGGPLEDFGREIADAPDGSSWVSVGAYPFNGCCVNGTNRLVHLDAAGQKLLADEPLAPDDIAVDSSGNVVLLIQGTFTPLPNAFLLSACQNSYAYVKLNTAGETLFASYLPPRFSNFQGLSLLGNPILAVSNSTFTNPTQRYEVIESQAAKNYLGCFVDAGGFSISDEVAPGEIVTLFGRGLGPANGVPFTLANGELPAVLGGTSVLVNSQPAPLLYVSDAQINFIVPFSLPNPLTSLSQDLSVTIQVQTPAGLTDTIRTIDQSELSLFRSADGQIAALNEDGSINNAAHPAKPGSLVVLFGTGGGQTNPPSTAGEVTPLEVRPAVAGGSVKIPISNGAPISLPVEYIGAAPGLVSGVTQINARLPNPIPAVAGYPADRLPLYADPGGSSFNPAIATIAVAPN